MEIMRVEKMRVEITGMEITGMEIIQNPYKIYIMKYLLFQLKI